MYSSGCGLLKHGQFSIYQSYGQTILFRYIIAQSIVGVIVMKILHELLATEKNFTSQVNKLQLETLQKFDKDHFFKGYIKTLKMLKDAPNNEELELAGSEKKELVTTVKQTLEYLLTFWINAEDLQATKNVTNQRAVADVEVNGKTLLTNLPVDELMGLESRLIDLRKVFEKMPTLDASKTWIPSLVSDGAWEAAAVDVTVKTEKVLTPVVLYEATKEHPAQVKEVSKDEVVGTFTTKHFSGASTSLQKAQCLERLDVLLVEIKRARMRANTVAIQSVSVGQSIVDFITSGTIAQV
jgi:hypothetical protein